MIVREDRDHALRQASAGDARITRIGRLMRATAMDELPQLVNIFKGDMSFVGPRALMPGEIETGGDGRVIAMEEIRGLPRTHRRPAGTDRNRADLRAARRDAATQVPLRSALRQAPVFLAGHPAHTAVVLDQHARHVGASSAEVLATPRHGMSWSSGRPRRPQRRPAAGLRSGLSVLVLEEHEQIGDPVHCTGVLGLDAFAEFDLPRETISTITRSARFHGGSRPQHPHRRRRRGCGRRRPRPLRSRARRACVRAPARRSCAARRVACARRSGGVTARVAIGDRHHAVRARVCVLACGAHYRFNRQLGLGIPRAYLQSAQLEMPFPRVDDVEIDLDRSLAPRGFAWIVPFTRGDVGMARVGLMATDTAAIRFKAYARRLGERHGAEPATVSPRLKVLPLAPVKRTYADRVVAVGDAAGLAKPTTGGGIYYSLLSGRYAAEVLSSALRQDRTDAAALKPYETLWQARIGPELRAGLAFRTLVARFDDRAIDALLELAAVDGIVPLLRRTANFNWHRAAALALLKNPGFRTDRAVQSLDLEATASTPNFQGPKAKALPKANSQTNLQDLNRQGWLD